MAYSASILTRAEARLRQAQEEHRRAQAQRREAIYQALPRTAAIDRQLRQLAPKILSAALRQGGDQAAALAGLRRENLALQEEERALLTQAGYPADALDDVPLCPLCGDRGWKGAAMCSCLEKLCRQEQIAELSSLLDLGDQRFETFRLDYYSDQQDPQYGRSPRETMGLILSICQQYAQGFGAFPHKNLFLYGAPGLGKTFLSACIARTAAEGGHSVVYDTAAGVFARFEDKKFLRYGEEGRQAGEDTRRYLACDLLILDDLGSEFTSPFVQAALYQVVNQRLIDGKHTVISSNLDLEGVRQRYSPQVASRLQGDYLPLGFVGEDIRLRRKG